MHLRCTAAAVAVVALSSSAAHADEKWYGYYIIGTDTVGVGLFVGGVQSHSEGLLPVVGLGVMLLGAPIVHAAHGNYGRGGLSLGMRVAAPLLLGKLGHEIGPDLDAKIPGLILGGILGFVAASAIDIAVLAREESPETAPRMFSIGGRL